MITYINGRLPDSALAPIPGGQLLKDAAAAWNAMCARAKQLGLPVPMPDGPDSSYRPYARQVYYKDYWCARGACENAAEPGTSRHGLGIAVDCAEDAIHHAHTIDLIGEEFGWSKKWSDAPWEPWHNTWKAGIWRPPAAVDLRVGDSGRLVKILSARLRILGLMNRKSSVFGGRVHHAVVAFQRQHKLTPDGIVGPRTWNAIKQAAERAMRGKK